MSLLRYVLPLALGLAAFPTTDSFAQPAATEQLPPQPNVQAMDAQAKKLFAAGDTQGALGVYRQISNRVSGRTSWDVAANHGNMAYQLGLHAEAAERFRYSLRSVPTSDANYQVYHDKIQKRLDEASAHVGMVTLVVAPAGAEILIDGVSHGRAPLAESVFVTPGGREVQAVQAGFETQSQKVNIVAGEASTVTFTLVATTNAAPPPPVVLPPAKDEGMSGLQIGGIALLAIGGAAGIAAAIVGSTSNTSAGKVAQLHTELPNSSDCNTGTVFAGQCGRLASAASDEASFRDAAVGLGISSGVLVITGVLALTLGGDEGSDSLGLSISPSGAILRGSF